MSFKRQKATFHAHQIASGRLVGNRLTLELLLLKQYGYAGNLDGRASRKKWVWGTIQVGILPKIISDFANEHRARRDSSSLTTLQTGFTLIEVLIVIAVIGLLAAIAYPNYSEYVTRSRLSEPRAKLAEMRTRLEQYYQDRRTYLGACVAGTVAPLPVDAQYFQYSCPTLLADSYVIRADGLAAQGMNGFRFEINDTNTRSTPAAPAGWATSANCWVRDRAGAC